MPAQSLGFEALQSDWSLDKAIVSATRERGLSRLLVPANYVLEPRFEHDLALNVPPLPTTAALTMRGETPRSTV